MTDFKFSLQEILSDDFGTSVLRAHKRQIVGGNKRIQTTNPTPGAGGTLSVAETMMNQGLTNSFPSIAESLGRATEPLLVAALGKSKQEAAYSLSEPFIPADITQAAQYLEDKGLLPHDRRQLVGSSTTAATVVGSGVTYIGTTNHVSPVEGVGPEGFTDSQGAPRPPPHNWHKGCDIFAAEGTRVFACVGGTVAAAGQAGDYDYRIRIDTTEDAGAFGLRTHFYDHLKDIKVVQGQTVVTGQHIASVGVVHDGAPNGRPGITRHCHFSNNKRGGSETADINIAHWLKTGEYKAWSR